MLVRNARAERGEYDPALRAVMNVATARENRRWLEGWSALNSGPTPLYGLPGLARRFGVARVCVKDESVRSPLGSFKALGAPIALVRFILRARLRSGLTAQSLLAGAHADALRDLVVISASDGNHGRALAAAARSVGCRCVIVLHARVSAERETAIQALGARTIRIDGTYDDSVSEAARLAAANGWQAISDTSYDGYEDVPRDVMQGYAVIADELVEQSERGQTPAFSHVFVQAGVGGLAAGVVSYFHERYGANRPTFIAVEPAAADCLAQSAIRGAAAHATGSGDSVMAGLACGTTSPLAWRFLETTVDYFCTVHDEQVPEAMRLLAKGSAEDVPIVAGESGVAGLIALSDVAEDGTSRNQMRLDETSTVLLINTEGDTAPSIYMKLAGGSANAVRAAQGRWLRDSGRNNM